MNGFDSRLKPIEAPGVVSLDRLQDPPPGHKWQVTPLVDREVRAVPLLDAVPAAIPLTPEGDIDWVRLDGETVTIDVDTDRGFLTATVERGGFTTRYAGPFRGSISISTRHSSCLPLDKK